MRRCLMGADEAFCNAATANETPARPAKTFKCCQIQLISCNNYKTISADLFIATDMFLQNQEKVRNVVSKFYLKYDMHLDDRLTSHYEIR